MYTIGLPRYEQYAVRHRFAGREEIELPVPLVGFPDCQAINARIVCNGSAIGSETTHLLTMLEQWEARQTESSMIMRVEFLHRKGDESQLGLRGAVLYDGNEQPFVHLVNALLGYDGSGPTLSRKLLTQVLHMSTQQAEEINETVRVLTTNSLPYVAIVDLHPISYRWDWKIVPE